LAKIAASLGPGIFVNWTIGVLPIRSMMFVTGGKRGRGKAAGF
jgi:hypothetical protein